MNVGGPSTYSIVGALNKVPLTLIGFLIFKEPIDWKNATFISFGIVSGIIFSKAKYEETKL